MIKIIIADDHGVVREGLKFLLNPIYGDQNIILVRTGKELLQKLDEASYDLLISDVELTDSLGFSLIPKIIEKNKNQKILVFSTYDELLMAQTFLHLGASGYVNKESSKEEIFRAVQVVLEGGTYLSRAVKEHFLDDYLKKKNNPNPYFNLSTREKEVMMLLLNGKETGEISYSLNLKNTTISTFRKRIFNKMGVNNVIDLYKKGILLGLA